MDILQTDIYSIQNTIPRSSLLLTTHSSFVLLSTKNRTVRPPYQYPWPPPPSPLLSQPQLSLSCYRPRKIIMRFHQSPPVPYYQKILIIPVVLVLGILIVHPNTSKISTNKSSKIPFIPLPMCDPDGRCHENPTIPSPRTIYSSFSKTQEKLWQNVHETLKQTSKDYVNRRNFRDIVMTKPLLLLGDSITESWLGTSYGRTAKRTAGIPKVLEAFTYPSWDPLVLAVSGEQNVAIFSHQWSCKSVDYIFDTFISYILFTFVFRWSDTASVISFAGRWNPAWSFSWRQDRVHINDWNK